ncbi:hypothetical protein BASA81_009641 [Batrachochytrium salamandrivorans]|nr:hypothetical protein BASA81_009641 [Batrachochytrium salamandrivorans]
MKLISFAVISFLAITVSAYPGLGTPSQDLEGPQSTTTQDLEESQGATTQSEQQHQGTIDQSEQENSQQLLQDPLVELIEQYKEKQAETDRLQHEIDVLEEETSEMESRAKELDEPGIMDLVREFIAKDRVLVRAYASKEALEREMEAITVRYDEVEKKMALLNETQE